MGRPVTAPRDRLVLSLDVGGQDAALLLAARLAPWFATAKVGYELYAEAGPGVFDRLHDLGFGVFADLKLHDIPTTVARGARVLGRRGIRFLNFHAGGGVAMLRAGVEGLREGALDVGHAPPIALGVTVLTSEPDTDRFAERLASSRKAGCDGVVCATAEIGAAHSAGLRTMVAGIRFPGGDRHDQARVATPAESIGEGADWLVIGRAVAGADDPEAAATDLTTMVAEASLPA
jgi:orotidine-5'-phosphate decarboxylase